MTEWSGYLKMILEGAAVTAELTIMGSALALVVAFVAGLGRIAPWSPVRWLSSIYIEFFRGTSIFVQLFWVYFVLPFAGITLSPLFSTILCDNVPDNNLVPFTFIMALGSVLVGVMVTEFTVLSTLAL